MKQAGRYDWMLVAALSATVVVLTFPALVLHPNSSLFTIGGDGIKNYFTALYYLQYNSGVHFNGMNYPFGEHLSFADAQPGLMIPFQWLTSLFPLLKGYSVAFFNYSVIAGMVLGSTSLLLLLKELKATRFFSITGALAITFLSPQLFRIESHYGLSYIFAFPLSWYLYLRTEKTTRLVWATAAVFFISWTGLLHFYLAVITCLFLLGYAFFSTVLAWKSSTRKQQLLRWLIPVASLLLLQVFMKVSDTVTDRPSKPWGFFTALADWNTVFLPHESDLLVQTTNQPGILQEGFSYLGIIPILFLCILVVCITLGLLIKNKAPLLSPLSAPEQRFLLSAVCLFLFSMGIPFIWDLEWLTDKISFMKQFRGLGRFAWALYYCSGVLTLAVFSHWYRMSLTGVAKKWTGAALALCLLVWTTEAGWRMKTVHQWNEQAGRNYLLFMGNNYHTLLTKNGVFPARYQALISLPYHHIGSEKFALDQWPSPYYAMKASLQSGIPGLNVMLSRTSLSQSCLQMQLTGDTVLEKELVSLLDPAKPILLITPVNGTLSTAERSLVQQSRQLCTDGEVIFYELPVAAFHSKTAAIKEQYRNKEGQLYQQPGYYTSLPNGTALLKYTDTAQAFSQATLLNQSNERQPLLLDTVMNRFNAGDTLHISLWLEIESEKDEVPVLLLRERHKGRDVGTAQFPSKTSRDVTGRRIRVSGEYVLHQSNSRLILSLHMGSRFSHLLIRRKDVNVFVSAGKEGFLYNNLPIPWK